MKLVRTLSSALACLALFQCSVTIRAADDWSPPLNLFDRSTLAGWEYGSPDRSGWTMKDGVLHADSPPSPLLAGWTFGDFELEFNWSVTTTSSWIIDLYGLPSVPPPQLCFTQDHKAGTALGGKGMVLIAVAAAAEHTAAIHRHGAKLTVIADGEQLYACDIDARARLMPQIGADELKNAKGTPKLWNLRVREPVGQPIFNGRDLAGWWTPGNLASWPVIDGNLVCINQKGDYLRTEKEYGNFVLSFDYKMAKAGNSGVGIRTPGTAGLRPKAWSCKSRTIHSTRRWNGT